MSTGRPAEQPRPRAIFTVDFEDYRYHVARDRTGETRTHPTEVRGQLERLLEVTDASGIVGTFLSCGHLARELPSSVWSSLQTRHRIGCHGFGHFRVAAMGRKAFREDLVRAKHELEDVVGSPVISFRAPYFSGDGCDPWFGEILAESGFRIDSSRRFGRLPAGSKGTTELSGSGGAVTEVPLCSLGVGQKRLTIIGGTYFRLFPVHVIQELLRRAGNRGFIPMIYLHPYDLDPSAPQLEMSAGAITRAVRWRLADRMREQGRAGAAAKLTALSRQFSFEPLENVLES